MKPIKAVPILFSSDVRKSMTYFTEKLKFETQWEWDDPPTFGGVTLGDIEFFFCKDDQGQPGTWVSIVLDDVDAYYEMIRNTGAEILSPPDTKEWNMREMLVRCPDDHILRIGHNTDCD